MGKRLREEIASFNSPLVTEIRGRDLLNAIVIDKSKAKNASPDGFAWDICVDMAEMGPCVALVGLPDLYVTVQHLLNFKHSGRKQKTMYAECNTI